MRPNPNTWNNRTESRAVSGAERGVPSPELIEKYAAQAERFAKGQDIVRDKAAEQKRAMLITSFISQGHAELVTNARDRLNAASYIVRNDPHFIPDTVPEGHEAAFIAALAEELSKPEYNQ
jgi:hypothetical protein